MKWALNDEYHTQIFCSLLTQRSGKRRKNLKVQLQYRRFVAGWVPSFGGVEDKIAHFMDNRDDYNGVLPHDGDACWTTTDLTARVECRYLTEIE
jgi:hypothetical protein